MVVHVCSSCQGSGRITCSKCHGRRIFVCSQCHGTGRHPVFNWQCSCWTGHVPCLDCSRGEVVCDDCKGTGQVNVVVSNVLVSSDVYANNQLGFAISMDFNVINYKDISCAVSVLFLDTYNNRVKSVNGATEELFPFFVFTPPYESAQYTGLSLFVPYESVRLPPGEHRLKYSIHFSLNSSPYTSLVEPIGFYHYMLRLP